MPASDMNTAFEVFFVDFSNFEIKKINSGRAIRFYSGNNNYEYMSLREVINLFLS